MPLGVTLLELRRELRAEIGASLNPAQGVQAQDTIDVLLARQQRELWDAYNWQHLKMWVDIPLISNQEIYSYPPAMAFDQIAQIWVAQGSLVTTTVPYWANSTFYAAGTYARDIADNSVWRLNFDLVNGPPPLTFAQQRAAAPTLWTASSVPPPVLTVKSSWTPLSYGIKAHMVRPGMSNSGNPTRWGNVVTVNTAGAAPITNPVGQLRIMPVPTTDNLIMRFEGQAPLSPLVASTDTCIIDSKVIVLFAAAEMLAVQKSEAAPMKLTKAQNALRRVLADQGADKRQNYNMGGNQRGGFDPDKSASRVRYLDYIPN